MRYGSIWKRVRMFWFFRERYLLVSSGYDIVDVFGLKGGF